MKNLNIVLSVVGGVLTGAVVGLLFAPDKGVETRKKIAKCVKNKCHCSEKRPLSDVVEIIEE